VVSPFEGGKATAGGAGGEEGELPFTVDSVDVVLDEVRPYLIADGGNCRVVSVDADSGKVALQLEGACGTCPSSTVTMKQGIERVLREKVNSDRLSSIFPGVPNWKTPRSTRCRHNH
jgi:Fe-S cluster biogenesis protein NfuA